MSDSRAVLVTGGSRGIGRAIAHAFAAAGDRVAVHWGTSRERAEAVLAQLPGDGHVLVQADLGDPDAVGRMVDEGLGACFFGVPAERVDALRTAFGVPDTHRPVGVVSVGYPGAEDRRSPSLRRGRRGVDEVVHRGRW